MDDESLIKSMEAFCQGMTPSGYLLAGGWLKERGWIAHPVLADINPDLPDDRLLLDAIAAEDGSLIFCALTDEPDSRPYKVTPADRSDIRDLIWSDEFLGGPRLVCDTGMSRCLYQSMWDHYVVVGPLEYVRQAVGCDLTTGLSRFRAEVEPVTESWTKERWREILNHYVALAGE